MVNINSASRSRSARRHANQSDHLAFEFVEAHQVQRVLQDAAEAAVIFGRAEDYSIRLLDLLAEAGDAGSVAGFVLANAESKVVIVEIDQPGLGATLSRALQGTLYSAARVASGSEASRYSGYVNGGLFFTHTL